jgi:hypothetical protein
MATLPGALEDNGRHARGMAWYCVDIIDNIICFPTVEVERLSLFISPQGPAIASTTRKKHDGYHIRRHYAMPRAIGGIARAPSIAHRRHPKTPLSSRRRQLPGGVHAMPCPRDQVPGRQRGAARRARGDLRRGDRRLTCRDRKETRASGGARWQALRLLLALSHYEWREAVANFFAASPLPYWTLSRRRRWTARAEWPGALAALRFALSPDLSARSNASRSLYPSPGIPSARPPSQIMAAGPGLG